MNHRIKIIGLALATVVALSAWTATAQGEPGFETLEVVESEGAKEEVAVHSNVKATEVSGEPAKFSVGGVTISCPIATGTTTLASGSTSTLTLSPSYGECKASLFFPAEVSAGSCGFAIHGAEETEADTYSASTDLTCSGGGGFVITIRNMTKTKTKCIIDFPAQSNLKTIKLVDMTEAEPVDTTLTAELKEVTATVTKGEEECLAAPGTYKNGTFTARTTITAANLAETPPVKAEFIKYKKFHFSMEEETMAIEGRQDTAQEWGFDLGKAKCKEVFMEQKSVTSKETIMLEFKGGEFFANCEFGGNEIEVLFNGCTYRWVAKAIEFGEFRGRTFIVCPPGKTMEVKTANCDVIIPEQDGVKHEGLSSVVFRDVGAGANREVTAELNMKALNYEEQGEGCKSGGIKTNGTFTGSVLFNGREKNGLNRRGIWISKTVR